MLLLLLLLTFLLFILLIPGPSCGIAPGLFALLAWLV
jgi:hypothetical protein